MTTMRAQEALGPSPPVQRVEALVFGAIEFEELAQADPFLGLYRVARHDKSSFFVRELHGEFYK